MSLESTIIDMIQSDGEITSSGASFCLAASFQLYIAENEIDATFALYNEFDITPYTFDSDFGYLSFDMSYGEIS